MLGHIHSYPGTRGCTVSMASRYIFWKGLGSFHQIFKETPKSRGPASPVLGKGGYFLVLQAAVKGREAGWAPNHASGTLDNLLSSLEPPQICHV